MRSQFKDEAMITTLTKETKDSPSSSKKAAMQEYLLKKHLPLVRMILSKMKAHFPTNTDWEELHGAGVLGLVEAVHKFDPSRGYNFETFASFRVRGAIQDSLRNLDILSRSARKKCKLLSQAEATLSQKLGRDPNESEIQAHMGLSALKLRKMRVETAARFTVSLQDKLGDQEHTLEDELEDESAQLAYSNLENSEFSTLLAEQIEALPYRQRKIIHLYYFEGLRLHQIAAELSITEARVSQIRTEALGTLRGILSELR